MNKASALSLMSSLATLVLSLTTPAHSEGSYTPLSFPGAAGVTEVSGINDLGQVVGSYWSADFQTADGFLYSNGVYSTLDYPGAVGTSIIGINNSGEMIGSYSTGQNSFSFLHSDTALSTPEPSTWAMMLIGFVGLGFAGYRASRKNVALAA